MYQQFSQATTCDYLYRYRKPKLRYVAIQLNAFFVKTGGFLMSSVNYMCTICDGKERCKSDATHFECSAV